MEHNEGGARDDVASDPPTASPADFKSSSSPSPLPSSQKKGGKEAKPRLFSNLPSTEGFDSRKHKAKALPAEFVDDAVDDRHAIARRKAQEKRKRTLAATKQECLPTGPAWDCALTTMKACMNACSPETLEAAAPRLDGYFRGEGAENKVATKTDPYIYCRPGELEEAVRALYAKQYAPAHIATTFRTIETERVSADGLLDKLLLSADKVDLTISFIGAGPGSDFLGVLHYMTQRLEVPAATLSITCHLLDLSGWEDYWTQLKSAVAVHFPKVILHLHPHFDATADSSSEHLPANSHLYVISHFIPEMVGNRAAYSVQFDRMIDRAQPEALFMFIDPPQRWITTYRRYLNIRNMHAVMSDGPKILMREVQFECRGDDWTVTTVPLLDVKEAFESYEVWHKKKGKVKRSHPSNTTLIEHNLVLYNQQLKNWRFGEVPGPEDWVDKSRDVHFEHKLLMETADGVIPLYW